MPRSHDVGCGKQPARPRNQPQESSRIQRCERRETLPFLESAHRSVDLQRGRAFAFWLCEKDNPTEGAPKLEIRERNLESRKRTKPAPKGFGGVRLQQVSPESLGELRPLAKRSRLRPAAAGVPDRVGSAWRQQTSNTESRSCGTEHRTAESTLLIGRLLANAFGVGCSPRRIGPQADWALSVFPHERTEDRHQISLSVNCCRLIVGSREQPRNNRGRPVAAEQLRKDSGASVGGKNGGREIWTERLRWRHMEEGQSQRQNFEANARRSTPNVQLRTCSRAGVQSQTPT